MYGRKFLLITLNLFAFPVQKNLQIIQILDKFAYKRSLLNQQVYLLTYHKTYPRDPGDYPIIQVIYIDYMT